MRLAYAPGLDGLRGLAVLAVLFFHAGVRQVGGGFVGVSVFFTLSGFLIGSLLIAEVASTGTVALKGFWARRARRLLPGALVTVALVVLLAGTVLPSARADLRGDVIGAIGYVANWRFWLNGSSYAALFTAPSPLVHFWSLAIEEQLNVILPLVVLWVVSRWGRARLGVFLVGLWVVTTALAVVVGFSGRGSSLGYYSTFTRAPELLTGTIVAWHMLRRPKRPTRWFDLAGLVGLGVLGWLVSHVGLSTEWLYKGGFAAISFASTAVVVAATQPGGLVSRALGVAPLRMIGRISYGIYLYHWPLFLVLTPERLHLSFWPLTLVRFAVAFAAAVVSFVFIEEPVRRGRALRTPRTTMTAVGALGAVVAAALLLPASSAASASVDFGKLSKKLEDAPALAAAAAPARAATAPTTTTPYEPTASTAAGSLPSTTPAPTTTVPRRVPLVGFFGDSTALMTGIGMQSWGFNTGDAVVVGNAQLGCPLMRGGEVEYPDLSGRPARQPVKDGCDWSILWPAFMQKHAIDVAVIQFGPWDVSDRRFVDDAEWRHPGDPVFDEHLRTEMAAATKLFTDRGIPVVWLEAPQVDLGHNKVPRIEISTNEPARMTRFNQVMTDVVTNTPGAALIDLPKYMAESFAGGVMDDTLRFDGVHFLPESAAVVAEWLGPAVIAAGDAARRQI